jgi:hypothetical protein
LKAGEEIEGNLSLKPTPRKDVREIDQKQYLTMITEQNKMFEPS